MLQSGSAAARSRRISSMSLVFPYGLVALSGCDSLSGRYCGSLRPSPTEKTCSHAVLLHALEQVHGAVFVW